MAKSGIIGKILMSRAHGHGRPLKNFTQITKLYLYYFTEIREDGVFVQVQDNSLYFILFFIMLILQQQHNLKERVREK